jgi:hypothetical protein
MKKSVGSQMVREQCMLHINCDYMRPGMLHLTFMSDRPCATCKQSRSQVMCPCIEHVCMGVGPFYYLTGMSRPLVPGPTGLPALQVLDDYVDWLPLRTPLMHGAHSGPTGSPHLVPPHSGASNRLATASRMNLRELSTGNCYTPHSRHAVEAQHYLTLKRTSTAGLLQAS